MIRLICLIFVSALGLAAGPAPAQGLFSPVVTVNDRVITAFEVDQRAQMLDLFRTPGDTRAQAIDALINERLQMAEADRVGLEISEEEVLDGMEEFAGRANLSREDFVANLARDGVDEETFRDFVRAGIAWRRIVRARFGGRVDIPEDEVAREAAAPPSSELRVLLSEIILPANTPERAAEAERLAPQLARINGASDFAAAAREYSASPSRDQGGALEWLEVSNLPPVLRNLVVSLSPGEVSPPVGVPNAIAIFQLRALEEVPSRAAVRELDYAALYLPGGRTPETLQRAARIAARVDTCDDLYAVAREEPDAPLQRDTKAPAEIPADVALALGQLDPGESSTSLTRADGQTLVFLMLCDRLYSDPEEIDLDAIRNSLTNRRISRLADNYLAEMRANATIVTE
ncbi:periplasmic chaperone for outer membrane proteins SurA [Palleronia aestuarii]|uniref:Parvulin-like PPIase n=1 Tax=Palleronia aestuarii TaxID=568105 RepID=A0A2W7NH31_9RHOB|nr:peptidylprolyl isomerase [Palleronia aestuarii]PZX17507.1 periplasmic chaperone for outer membrane proteins SurA [Palleronia aestuarii]